MRRMVVLINAREVYLSGFKHKWAIDAQYRRTTLHLFGLARYVLSSKDLIAYVSAWAINYSFHLLLRICRLSNSSLKISFPFERVRKGTSKHPQVPCAPLTVLNMTNVQNHLGFKWWEEGCWGFWLCFFPYFLRRVRETFCCGCFFSFLLSS